MIFFGGFAVTTYFDTFLKANNRHPEPIKMAASKKRQKEDATDSTRALAGYSAAQTCMRDLPTISVKISNRYWLS